MIEIVEPGDPLAGFDGDNVGKIKLLAWRGPDFIDEPESDVAGVDWILAENWWPYQRPTFVTPPFAGYVSGHSTYSRAAAVLMTALTGDEFFPGGIGEFEAPRNEFLVFEDGPSVDLTLQWATYEDASDQTSLSRIWGGIHPPADDVPGRVIGERIGADAFAFAKRYFAGEGTASPSATPRVSVYPNPVEATGEFLVVLRESTSRVRTRLVDVRGRLVHDETVSHPGPSVTLAIRHVPPGVYFLHVEGDHWRSAHRVVRVR